MNDQPEDTLPRTADGPSPLWAVAVLDLVILCVAVFRKPTEEYLDGAINDVAAIAVYIGALGITASMVLARRHLPPIRPEFDQPLCTHCIEPYVQGAHFCPRCSVPLTVFAATGEYEQIYAQAWVLGRAARHPTRPLHVWFLTLMAIGAGLPVVAMASTYWEVVTDDMSMDAANTLLSVAGMATNLLWLWIWAALATSSWRNWRRFKQTVEEEPRVPEDDVPPWWTYDRWWLLPEMEDPL